MRILLFHHFSTGETVMACKEADNIDVWFSGYEPIDLATSLLNHLNISYSVYELNDELLKKNDIPNWIQHAEDISKIYQR